MIVERIYRCYRVVVSRAGEDSWLIKVFWNDNFGDEIVSPGGTYYGTCEQAIEDVKHAIEVWEREEEEKWL